MNVTEFRKRFDVRGHHGGHDPAARHRDHPPWRRDPRGRGLRHGEAGDLLPPLDGQIEFGETAEVALRREFREEIGADLQDVRYLFTLENIFTHQGEPGHEIVMVFEAALADARLYGSETLTGEEDDGLPFTAKWKVLSDFGPGRPPIYPDGLLGRLVEPQHSA